MRIIIYLIVFCLCTNQIRSQSAAIRKKIKNQFSDSSSLIATLNEANDFHSSASITSTEEGNTTQAFVPSILHSSRDLFASTAAFHFNARRFRAKGFAPNLVQAFINDIPMNQLADGIAPWSSWGGLNEIMANTNTVIGLKENDLSFGGFGGATYIDLKASHLRPQTTVSFFLSNRSYRYRFAFTKVIPLNKNGWAFAFSISTRLGENIVVPGSYFNAPSYFLAIDKKYHNHLFSFSLIGVMLTSSRVSAVTQETVILAGRANYNPNWGYQNGEIRNANLQKQHLPLIIFSHEYKVDDDLQFNSSVAFSAGEKSVSGLDWYKAADPRPDYYRYLPGFQTDSVLKLQVAQLYKDNPSLLQINWQRLYEVNSNGRANYIVEERVEQSRKFIFTERINQRVSDRLSLMANIGYQYQQVRYFKRVNDLLGGTFFMDWNQFADDQSVNPNALQNDLNRPDRKLAVGDAFGYDYMMQLQKITLAAQANYKSNRFDFFGAIELAQLSNTRIGLVRNGVFPNNSFGKTATDRFSSSAFKGGATYKLNGRNYFYSNLGFTSRPPFINDYYISPRTRDTQVSAVQMEKIFSADAGYILNAPLVKARLNIYAATFKNGMNIMSFYHDGYRNLVNYAIWNVNQLHFGIEASTEIQLTGQLRANLALALGKYTYNNRQSYSVSIDNEDYISEQGTVYSNNFPIAGTPQKAFSAGLVYQSADNLLLGITGNYLADYWLSFNPLRRTYEALSSIPASNDPKEITNPEKLPDVFVADFSAAYSFRINAKNDLSTRIVQLFLSVNNALNATMITGGYEQLRFDIANANTQKFLPKYYYNTTANYSLSIRLRL